MQFNLPQIVLNILKELEQSGFQAYIVGGCVRDLLLGNQPKDWDFCTSATPDEMIGVFKNQYKILTYGKEYGTITLHIEGENYEITTFRKESGYHDYRRPDIVEFTDQLEEDLSRRDFTINALAYGLSDCVIDIFGGHDDLKNGVIKAVGIPEVRFKEDSLRILRALKFASRYRFRLDHKTAEAMKKLVFLIKEVSCERITDEIIEMIQCNFFYDALQLLQHYKIFDSLGFQLNFMKYTDRINHLSQKLTIRVSALLYIIGKNFAAENIKFFCMRKTEKSKILVIMEYLMVNIFSFNRVKTKIMIRDIDPLEIKHFIKLYSILHKVEVSRAYMEEIEKILSQNKLLFKRELVINGHDLLARGFKGKEIGEMLNEIYYKVLEETLLNTKEALLKYIDEKKGEKDANNN